jgi:hypothetical protein
MEAAPPGAHHQQSRCPGSRSAASSCPLPMCPCFCTGTPAFGRANGCPRCPAGLINSMQQPGPGSHLLHQLEPEVLLLRLLSHGVLLLRGAAGPVRRKRSANCTTRAPDSSLLCGWYTRTKQQLNHMWRKRDVSTPYVHNGATSAPRTGPSPVPPPPPPPPHAPSTHPLCQTRPPTLLLPQLIVPRTLQPFGLQERPAFHGTPRRMARPSRRSRSGRGRA